VLGKRRGGEANTNITAGKTLKKTANGAVIGAAVSLTISGLTNYISYKKGEITRKQAFINIGEDSAKGAIMGGEMSAVSIFLPAGAVGFISGLAIGVYLNATLTNILDEIFGKGAHHEILAASGCVMSTSKNLCEALESFSEDRKAVQEAIAQIKENLSLTDAALKNKKNRR